VIPADVFLDDHGRLRRMHLTLTIHPQALGLGGAKRGSAIEFAEIIDLYHFGVEIHVSPPPASRVVDIGGLVQGDGATKRDPFSSPA
jgi:hypothetical protein